MNFVKLLCALSCFERLCAICDSCKKKKKKLPGVQEKSVCLSPMLYISTSFPFSHFPARKSRFPTIDTTPTDILEAQKVNFSIGL